VTTWREVPASSAIFVTDNSGILAQIFTDFELILVDDGSPDGCGAICDEYLLKDSRVRVIHQLNGGPSAARNSGLDLIFSSNDSQWITFIDSDDWIDDCYLSTLYKMVIDNNVKCSVCGFSIEYDYQNTDRKRKSDIVISSPDNFYGKYFWDYSVVSLVVAWAKLYNRHLFQNIRYPVNRLGEDRFTTYKIIFQCESIAVCDCNLYKYYQSPGSIMRSKWNPKRLDEFDAYDEELVFYKNGGYVLAYKRTLSQYLKELNLMMNTVKEQAEYQREYQELKKRQRRDMKLYYKQCGITLINNPYYYIHQYPCISKMIMALYAIKGKLLIAK